MTSMAAGVQHPGGGGRPARLRRAVAHDDAVEDPVDVAPEAVRRRPDGRCRRAGGGRGRNKRLGGLNRTLGRHEPGRVDRGPALAGRPAAHGRRIHADLLLVAGLAWRSGWLRGGMLFGGRAGASPGCSCPLIYLNIRANKRREAFTANCPTCSRCWSGALRAGYGVTQAIDMLVDRMAKPASIEFGRVMRAVNLGMPVNRALNDMADRAGSDDLYLVVTAMNVQAGAGWQPGPDPGDDHRDDPGAHPHQARDSGAHVAAAHDRLHAGSLADCVRRDRLADQPRTTWPRCSSPGIDAAHVGRGRGA